MRTASKSRNHKRATLLAAAIGAGALFTHYSEGATFTWDGGGVGSNWTTAGNWTGASGGIAPSGTLYDVQIGTGGAAATVNANQVINGLYFNRAGDFTVSGTSSLTLNSISAAAPSSTGRTYTVSAPLTLAVTNVWNVDSSLGSTTLTVSNIISDGTSTLGVTKTGSGLLILSNVANIYKGATTINGGTLEINTLDDSGGSGIGNAGNGLVLDGGFLRYVSTVAGASARGYTLGAAGGGFDASSTSTADTLTISGVMTASASTGSQTLTLTGSNTGANTVSGSIVNGSGSNITHLVKLGAGDWAISGNKSFTGTTTINDGTLSITSLANGGSSSPIGASGSLASNLVINGGALSYSGASVSTDRLFSVGTDPAGATIESSGTGAMNFTNPGQMGFNGQSGARTLTLRGSNTGNNTLAAQIGDNGGATSLVKEGSSRWILSGANTYTGLTSLNNGTLAYGASNVISDSAAIAVNGSSAVLDLGSNQGDTIGGFSLIAGSVVGSTSSLTLNTGSYDIRSGTISTSLRGSAGLTKTTTGTATITVASGYLGAASITAGTLATGVSSALASTGSVTVNGSTAVLDLGANHTLTQAGVVLDGDGTITGSGTSALTLNSGSYDLRNGTVAVPLNGTAGVNKTTANTVSVNSNSGYTGKTIVRDGTLTIEGSGSLSGTSGVTVYNGGTFKLDNSTSISDDRLGNVDVTLNSGTFNYDGVASSTSSSRSDETINRLVLESGNSTLTLAGSSGNNTRASLTLGNATSSISRAAGSTMVFIDNADGYVNVQNYTEANNILGGWALYGDGTFAALSGTNTGSIIAATVDNASTLTSTWTATQNVRLTGAGSTSTVNPAGASLTINSVAMAATSGASISISAGKTLVVDSGGILLATSSHNIAGAGSITAGSLGGYELTVHNTSLNNGTISATIANNGANALTLTKGGIGILKLSGANTYTGPTYVAAGTLSLVSASNNIASSSLISVQSGATLDVAGITGGFKLGTNQKLKGNGTVAGNVTADAVGSTIAPGNSPGKLTFTGNLTLNSNATYEVQIGGTGTGTGTAGIDFDQIVVTGSSRSVTLGSAQLKILPMPGIVTGQTYRIVTGTSGATVVASNIFKNLTQNLNAGGPYTQGNVTFNIDYGYGANGYVDVTFSAVPEPTSLSVLAIGACGLLQRRRRGSKR